jgi:GTPase SAR1 family protein
MTKTYFRRADGVILLYDVTSERSFMNVRQWIQNIDVSRTLTIMNSYTFIYKSLEVHNHNTRSANNCLLPITNLTKYQNRSSLCRN